MGIRGSEGKALFTIVLSIIALVVLAGCGVTNAQHGMLEGTVTIGPIWPVERPVNPPVPPQVFEVRKVMIYDEQGNKLRNEVDIHQIAQGPTGIYQVLLNPGIYTVDIKHNGMDRSGNVPKQVLIKSGEVVKVDINIDTGIRLEPGRVFQYPRLMVMNQI